MNNIIKEIQYDFNNHYLAALKTVKVSYLGDSIVLGGYLKSYYHKALATSLAAKSCKNQYQIVNNIVVVKPLSKGFQK